MDTKKLRQKILDLAIRGKLVPQDPNDEPASVLLERIRTEKERLIKEGKIKKSKASKTSDTPHYENVPFEIPSSWEWTTLGEICFFENGYAFSSDDYTTSGIPLIRISNIKDNQISTENCVYIQGDYEDKFQICNGDLLIAMSGATTGKMGIYLSNKKAYLNQRVGNIKVIDTQSLCLEYRNLFLRSKSEEILKLAYGGAQPNISGAMISSLQVPLPPISEQYRIVIETERWFALIEQIEQGKADIQTAIKQTKSKILDLAIHGKLVPQDPNDEPASELLKRINPAAEITCDNEQYGKLPKGWCNCRLCDILEITMGQSPQGDSINSNEGIEFHQGKLCFSEKYLQHSNVFTTEPTKIAEVDSLLLCVRAPVGIVNISQRRICIGRGLCSLKPIYGTTLFYFYLLQTLKNSFERQSTGTTFKAISGDVVKKEIISLPPIAEQYRIVAKIEELFSSLDNIQKALEV